MKSITGNVLMRWLVVCFFFQLVYVDISVYSITRKRQDPTSIPLLIFIDISTALKKSIHIYIHTCVPFGKFSSTRVSKEHSHSSFKMLSEMGSLG